MDGTALTKRLGRMDRAGIDAFSVALDDDSILAAIQCKGFELLEYGGDQHRQCRDEIAKYKTKGPIVEEYWLVINRSIKDRGMRTELLSDLTDLVESGKATKVELLDLEPMLGRLRDLSAKRLAIWAEAKRAELFNYYAQRMKFVDYISAVPFNSDPIQIDPTSYILGRVERFFQNLREHQTGKYRPAPKILVTSSFGFGKTSALQALARSWIESGGHLIYAPAALLEDVAFANASGLADALLNFLIPEDAELSQLGHQVFRDTLRDTLAKSKDWLVLIDGLDENAAAFKPNSLSTLWGSMRDLGIPAILSARDELVEMRSAEFFPDPGLKIAPAFERISLNNWSDDLILRFILQFAEVKKSEEPSGFRSFRELIEAGRYTEIYGDIPKRPLFLGMLAEDAWSGHEPARQLHRLYGKYFRKKFALDRHSIAAGGASRRPSAIVDTLGSEETVERLIHVMQDASDAMLKVSGAPDVLITLQRDTISERELRDIANKQGLPFVQLEDVAMHSLLQPAGRDPVTRERLLRFAHRSFQDWFLARQFAEYDRKADGLPDTVKRFLKAMRVDLAAGKALP
jgi:hypothetical protein